MTNMGKRYKKIAAGLECWFHRAAAFEIESGLALWRSLGAVHAAACQRFWDARIKVLYRWCGPTGCYTLRWSGEYEFQLRARKRLSYILPIVFAVIFILLHMLFHSLTEAIVLSFPTIYAMTGGLVLEYILGSNFSVAAWIGYIALFGIAVETGVVMVVYLHEALDRRLAEGPVNHEEIEAATIEGAVQRLRPKLMTVAVVMLSLAPIL